MARIKGSNGQQTEHRIRDAAIRLVARHGYESMTLRQLADEVGLRSSSLYRYYPSKQLLLASLLLGHMRELLDEWAAEKPASSDARTLFIAFCEFHLRTHTQRQASVFIGNMELRSLEPEQHRAVVDLRQQYESVLGDILRQGVAQGCFHIPDLRLTTYALLAMLTGVCHWYREGGRLSQHEVIAIHTRLALAAVGDAHTLQAP